MAAELLRRTYKVRGRDFDKAGEIAAGIKGLLKELDLDANLIHRAVIIAFEAEMNVVMYAQEGTVTLVLTDEELRLEVSDRGPGIADIELALTEGYSTATEEMREMGFGSGLGLPNIKRNADNLNITSQVDVGTRVEITLYPGNRDP